MNVGNIATGTSSPATPPRRKRNGKAGKITVQEFLKKYSQREDGYKYEYQDGQVIKSSDTMNYAQLYILNNLTNFFYGLWANNKVKGLFTTELDTWFTASKMRRPDMCYLTPLQVYEADQGSKPVPAFVIEVISTNDTAEYYDDKLSVYFEQGVKVVWFIYPKSEKVQIYLHDESSTTCRGDMVCSAAPVLPAFALPAKDIFVKPEKPE
jgi:Uma2 family endonuclease